MRIGYRRVFAASLATSSCLLVAALLAAFFLASPAPADERDRDSYDEAKYEGALKEAAREVADEYFDAIDHLAHTLNRYSDYFSELNDAELREYKLTFEQFAEGIERGKYAQNVHSLVADINTLMVSLRSVMGELRNSSDSDDRELARELKSLRRELRDIGSEIDNYLAIELALHTEQQMLIQEYLIEKIEQARFEIGRRSEEQTTITIVFDPDSRDEVMIVPPEVSEALLEVADLGIRLEQLAQVDSLLDDHVREILENLVIELPGNRPIPVGPAEDIEPVVVITTEGMIVSYVREVRPEKGPWRKRLPNGIGSKWADSMRVSSMRTPVYVTHPVGGMEIEGWRSDLIVAELTVEVKAPSKELEKEFADNVTLELSAEKNGYYIETSFPALTDTRTFITTSHLKVFVPQSNRLNCDNSFGEVKISDLDSKVVVKGNYCRIDVTNISGPVWIENTSGEVSLTDIEGSADVVNSLAPVYAVGCTGSMVIENSGGTISVIDCQGELSLVNSGTVTVTEHSGRVSIENSDGEVSVLNLDGSLTAFNSYKPLVVQDITGSVNLENTNALIQAVGIAGSLEARNKYGDIHTEALAGPIDLHNEDGRITLSLDGGLFGPSSVFSSSGTIEVLMPNNIDLRLVVVSDNGDISSEFPMKTTDTGRGKQAEIVLGDGSQLLQLTGKHSSINIDESR